MGVYLWTHNLPSEYQEVEYIQSSGTQYINTGYTPTTSTEFNVTYQWVSYIGTFNTVFGCRRDYNDDAYYIGYTQTGDASYYCFGDNRSHPSAVRFGGNGNIFNITYTNNILSNGTDSITVTTNTNPLGSIYIFSGNWAGTSSEYGALKLYSFKLTTGGTDVRDFVPCYRKQDTEIGLYDLVNDVFYTNSGTGTFTKGADVNVPVQKELQNAYIGEWVDVTSLTLDKSSINLTTIGQTEQITATTVPAGATVTWSSSNTSVATVSSSGLVTCVSVGTCTITAESFGVTATCGVTGGGWAPGVNTVAYYEFDNNLNDSSGNGHNMSWYGASSYGTTADGATYADFDGSKWTYYLTGYPFDATAYTFSFRMNYPQFSVGGVGCIIDFFIGSGGTYSLAQRINDKNSTININGTTLTPSVDTRHYYTLTITNGTGKIYLDGADTGQTYTLSTTTGTEAKMIFGNEGGSSYNSYHAGRGKLSKFIMEDKTWTATDITNYYNQTKGDYGIS